MTAAVLAVLWLSFGGVLSTCLYHLFPGMSYLRYLSLSQSLASLFVILGAGFVLEKFVKSTGAGFLALACGLVLFLGDGLGNREAFYSMLEKGVGKTFAALPASVAQYMEKPPDSMFLTEFDLGAAGMWYFRVTVLACGIFLLLALKLAQKRLSSTRFSITPTVWTKLSWAVLLLVLVVDLASFGFVVNSWRAQGPETASLAKSLDLEPSRYADKRLFSNDMAFRGSPGMNMVISLSNGPVTKYPDTYQLAQMDACWPHKGMYFTTVPEGLAFLIHSREGRVVSCGMDPPNPPDAALMAVLGCGGSKMRLVSKAYYTESEKEAASIIRVADDLDSRVIIISGNQKRGPVVAGDSMANSRAVISVLDFSPDSISVNVLVPENGGGWLVLADAYSPGWRAQVDGKTATVEKAYGAFKAVRVGPGNHTIKFWYFRTYVTPMSYVMAAAGILGFAAFLVLFFMLLIHSELTQASRLFTAPIKN